MEDEHRWRLRQRQRLLFADLAGVPLSLAPDWDYPRPTAIPQDTLLKYVTSATPVGGPAGHALDKMALRLMEGDVARRALPLPPEVLYAGVHGPGPGTGSTMTGGLVAGLASPIRSGKAKQGGQLTTPNHASPSRAGQVGPARRAGSPNRQVQGTSGGGEPTGPLPRPAPITPTTPTGVGATRARPVYGGGGAGFLFPTAPTPSQAGAAAGTTTSQFSAAGGSKGIRPKSATGSASGIMSRSASVSSRRPVGSGTVTWSTGVVLPGEGSSQEISPRAMARMVTRAPLGRTASTGSPSQSSTTQAAGTTLGASGSATSTADKELRRQRYSSTPAPDHLDSELEGTACFHRISK